MPESRMSDRHEKLHPKHNGEDLGFERQDLGSRPIFGFIISLLVFGVLTYYVLWGMFHFLDAYNRKHQGPVSPMMKVEQDTRIASPETIQQFPEPRLEDDERTELNGFRLHEEQQLNSYGWVDQNAGVVHIPVEKAMKIIAQRGLPTTPQAGTMPIAPVNLARAAAQAADTSGMQAAPTQKQQQPAQGKKK
jgi:hypothetical protein